MPPVGFEPTISVLERGKTVRALDREATAIGNSMKWQSSFEDEEYGRNKASGIEVIKKLSGM
jgi:hypothetical protein